MSKNEMNLFVLDKIHTLQRATLYILTIWASRKRLLNEQKIGETMNRSESNLYSICSLCRTNEVQFKISKILSFSLVDIDESLISQIDSHFIFWNLSTQYRWHRQAILWIMHHHCYAWCPIHLCETIVVICFISN